MIQIDVDQDDVAKAVKALAPQMIRWQDNQLMIAVKQKTVALAKLKFSLQTDVAYDHIQAAVSCWMEDGHLHVDAELK